MHINAINSGLGTMDCPMDSVLGCTPIIGCDLSSWIPGTCTMNNGNRESVDTRSITKTYEITDDINSAYDSNGESCGELTRVTACTDCQYEAKLDDKCDENNQIWVNLLFLLF